MSDLTPELALVTAVDADDTADYLTQTNGLKGSLNIIDGLFNATSGHNHNGSHQGGTLIFNQLNTTSIRFANGATLGPTGVGNVLRFQSTQVEFSGAAKVEGALNVSGAATVTGNLSVSGTTTLTGALTAGTINAATLNVSGTATITGSLGAITVTTVMASGALSASDITASAGWFRNTAANTGLYNTAVGIGLMFVTGTNTPVVYNGPYANMRLHGSQHVRTGFFNTGSIAGNGGEAQIQVNYATPFPAGASPTCMLTLLRGPSDHMLWRIGHELGQVGPVAFNAHVRNDNATAESIYISYLAYWNE